MKIRKYLNKNEAEILGLTPKKSESKPHHKRNQARYYITFEQWDIVLKHRTTPNQRKFVETIRKTNKEGDVISLTEKLQSKPIEVPDGFEVIKISTSKTTGQQWVQYAPKKIEQVDDIITENLLENIVKKHIQRIEVEPKINAYNNTYFDRLVFTDVHIGMTPNANGYALYGGEWNEKVLMQQLNAVVDVVANKQQGNALVIDDLGDYLDGWDGQTTRKGHALPQNMDNEKAFDVAVNFKVKLIDRLVGLYDNITMNNICEDNHAGSFGYVVNSAVKMILEQKYKSVTIVNHRKFINHYYVGNHAFVITHGKDSKNLKFGFKPQLDPKQVEKIDQYLKVNNVYKNAEFIEFSKGDSHQCMFDFATSDDFDYCNYPAFSPSSEWVQTNFKKGRSGFAFQNINFTENEKINHLHWF